MYGEFADSVVLVTGAASGIGLETVRQFLAEGANVIGVDCDGGALEKARRDLGAGYTPRICDISREDQVRGVAQSVEESHGRLDSLINNAGVGRLCPVENMTEDDYSYHYDVNVKGTMFMVTHCLPLLRKSSYPSIVNVSSSAARCESLAHHFLYSSSKSSVLKYTMHLVRDLPGIRSNAVLPGWVDTSIYERAGFNREFVEDMYRQCLRTIPSGRIGLPEDIANCILFLCSKKASYVNGAALDINGGVLSGADWGLPL